MTITDSEGRVYTSYIRCEFAPFVQEQLSDVWSPDQFARISQVLSGDNYYRPPPDYQTTPRNRQKSTSTKHMLNWIEQRCKRPPLLSNLPDAYSRTHEWNTPLPKASKAYSQRHIPDKIFRGREVLAQVIKDIDDLDISCPLKQALAKRFCSYLLRKKLLKPYSGTHEKNLELGVGIYYYWNRVTKPEAGSKVPIPCSCPTSHQSATSLNHSHQSAPSPHYSHQTAPSPNHSHQSATVINLDEAVKSQMKELIKTQQDLIQKLEHRLIATPMESVHLSPESQVSPYNILHKISSDEDIYFDVHSSNTTDITSNRTPSVNPMNLMHRNLVQIPANIEDTSLSNNGHGHSGFLRQIKRNFGCYGPQSLFSTALGLKSYLFKGDSDRDGGPESENMKQKVTQNYKVATRSKTRITSENLDHEDRDQNDMDAQDQELVKGKTIHLRELLNQEIESKLMTEIENVSSQKNIFEFTTADNLTETSLKENKSKIKQSEEHDNLFKEHLNEQVGETINMNDLEFLESSQNEGNERGYKEIERETNSNTKPQTEIKTLDVKFTREDAQHGKTDNASNEGVLQEGSEREEKISTGNISQEKVKEEHPEVLMTKYISSDKMKEHSVDENSQSEETKEDKEILDHPSTGLLESEKLSTTHGASHKEPVDNFQYHMVNIALIEHLMKTNLDTSAEN